MVIVHSKTEGIQIIIQRLDLGADSLRSSGIRIWWTKQISVAQVGSNDHTGVNYPFLGYLLGYFNGLFGCSSLGVSSLSLQLVIRKLAQRAESYSC